MKMKKRSEIERRIIESSEEPTIREMTWRKYWPKMAGGFNGVYPGQYPGNG